MFLIPKEMFLTRGVGIHKEHLQSFELALRHAGIAVCNLVCVSSILPPKCRIISQEEGLGKISPGQIIFTVLSRNTTNELGRMITASIGVAQPADSEKYGYISEHHSFGQTGNECSDYAEDLAVSMFASTLGHQIPKDEVEYDESRELYLLPSSPMLPKGLVETESITQAAKGVKNKWTTVLAAAVFIL